MSTTTVAATRSGFPLVLQQYTALLRKNALLSWRSKRATLLQVLSPLIFIFLIFAVDKAIEAQTSTSSQYKSVKDPPSQPSPPIPPCEEKFFIKLPCYDFVWSGDSNPKFSTIVRRIMSNNPGRPIPASKVKSFSDKMEVDSWLLSNPMHCPGALHFAEKNSTVFSYGLQTNSTAVQKRGKYEDPTASFQLPLQLAAEREIARYLIGGMGILLVFEGWLIQNLIIVVWYDWWVDEIFYFQTRISAGMCFWRNSRTRLRVLFLLWGR